MRHGRDLEMFLEAVRTASFSEAARKLHVTPSAISKAVARLESATRSRLFDRNSYQLAVTPEGRAFADRAGEAMTLLDDAFHMLDDAQDHASGLIRVSSIASFGRHFITPLLPDFLAQYPDVSIELVFDEGMPDLIADGFDLAIRRGPIIEQDSVVRQICTLPLALVASPAYLTRAGVPAMPADLAEHECLAIQFASRRRASWIFTAPDGAIGTIAPRGRILVSEQPVDALIDLALMGQGIALVALPFVSELVAAGRLVVLLADHSIERPVEMFVQMPGRRHKPTRVKVFIDYLVERLRADPRLGGRQEVIADPSNIIAFPGG